jgi:hypothetical protein
MVRLAALHNPEFFFIVFSSLTQPAKLMVRLLIPLGDIGKSPFWGWPHKLALKLGVEEFHILRCDLTTVAPAEHLCR